MARELLEALGASWIEAEVTVLSAERRPTGMGAAPRLFEVEVRDGGRGGAHARGDRVAVVGPLRDDVRRSLEREVIQRALQLCHILTIRGRAYQQWLPAPAA